MTNREQQRSRLRQSRYVCPGCQGIAILAEPTEAIVAAAVAHRHNLPIGLLTRNVVAQAIDRVDVLSVTPGATAYDPSRLRVTWPDGTTTTGAPLDRRSPTPAPRLGDIKDEKKRIAAWKAWSAAALATIYDRAGRALAGVRPSFALSVSIPTVGPTPTPSPPSRLERMQASDWWRRGMEAHAEALEEARRATEDDEDEDDD